MKKVLVIDDDVPVGNALKRTLEQAGHEVRVVSDVADGLRRLREEHVDVVITDIVMPEFNGVEAIRVLKQEFPWVRVVAISGGGTAAGIPASRAGLTTQAYLAAAREAGAHATLAKPFQARELLLAIDNSVLVVDDEPAVRLAIKRVLEGAGYSVRVAGNGVEGLVELRARPVNIVIIDIIMPQLNGVETIRAIARDHPQTRIVAISGGGSYGMGTYKPNSITTTAYLSAAQEAGAHAALTKPFETSDILLAIGHATAAE